jgi:hypothetical protein
MLNHSKQQLVIVICFLLMISFGSSYAQLNSPSASYKLINGNKFIQSKNYYLLTLFSELPDAKKLLENDLILSQITKKYTDSLNNSLINCGRNGACLLNNFIFSETDIKSIGDRLLELYQPNNALGKLVQNHLIPSGCYVLFHSLSAKELLRKAWEQDAKGINYCVSVYGGGDKPNYPLIDSISFNTKDPANPSKFAANYVGFLYNSASVLSLENTANKLFFTTKLSAALLFLDVNEREQAADFEPMDKGENKLAVDKIKNINWNNFKYSVILIPGAGPDDPKQALSAEGKLRCKLAAILYKQGLAPFIVSSGGKVHPYKTPFCEATEQKKYLIEKLGIPASAIIIDPHARHTTTNMRNTVRLIFRYGMPFNKAAITCTTKGQSFMIANMIPRCMKELNLAPYKNGNRISETALEFYPLIEALHINPNEPIDP